MGVYTIRDLDKKTKQTVQEYAADNELNIAEAMRELIAMGLKHIKHSQEEKQYKSFFDLYEKIKFKGGKRLSEEHDKVAYEL
ncbi:hypothetical protein HZC08_01270 [Candidatus Micrarchaeota archaeon]|nr:hypothetical protein [Candidatus Micrarchaeota archaeon]